MRQRFPADQLDPGTFWLLKTLRQHGSLRVTELAMTTGLDTSTVSRHVSQLTRSGMVERTPDPEDGRAQLVQLSQAGLDTLHRAYAERRALMTRSLADWSPADVETLSTLLTRFVGSAEELAVDLEPR